MAAEVSSLDRLVADILSGGTHFLSGVHNRSVSRKDLFTAMKQWATSLGRSVNDVSPAIESCVRQSILMSLIPAKAVTREYIGPIEPTIQEHLDRLGISVDPAGIRVLRDVCLNVRKLYGKNREEARRDAYSLARLKGNNPILYRRIRAKQGDRCIWCGAPLDSPGVHEELDHVAPHRLGDDLPNGENWALSCASCNRGKGEALAWGALREASDYLGRQALDRPTTIGLEQRWVVLMRVFRCDRCGKPKPEAELFVYKRIVTGLPIPANCSAACGPCCQSDRLEMLPPKWDRAELDRSMGSHPAQIAAG